MKRRSRAIEILLIALLPFLFPKAGHSQINITPAQTAAVLAQKLAGEGVTIINPTLSCAAQANGLFSVVSSNLGLDSGIVLTTGRAATIGGNYGVNGKSAFLASTDNGYPGDIALTPLAGQSTLDACSLEFDIIPDGDSIQFNYVFSSEEYKNAVCGPYNDAFAFFINGPGISGADNMALVPGTNIPVTINTINDGIPGSTGDISNCTSMGAGAPFTAYYIDNSAGQALTHQGLTAVLQAVHAVTPCSTYHLKIAIADAGDPLYDSGVFLKAGSLQAANYHINALVMPVGDTTEAICVKGCLTGHFHIRRSQAMSQAQTIKFIVGGNAVPGVDYSAIGDSVVIPANDTVADVAVNGLPTPLHGTKTIQLHILSPYSCAGTDNIVDSASMLIYDTLHISLITPDSLMCGNNSVQLLVDGSNILTYSWSPTAGINNPGIKDPIATPSASTAYYVTASIPGTTCTAKMAAVNFTIKLTPSIALAKDTGICYNTSLLFTASALPANLYYKYQWAGPAGFTSALPDPQISNASAADMGVYTLSVTNDTNGCSARASIAVTVTIPDTPGVVSPVLFCLNNAAAPLTAKGSNILWYTADNGIADTAAPVPPTAQTGAYEYYVTQTINNCESPKAAIEVKVEKCCDGNIFIPTAFTPNGDGLNDRFRPIEDYGYFIETMYIFNRWGQIVYSGLRDGWDGKLGGRPADLGTYFYNITFGCILGGSVERKGEVTLIR